MQALPPHGGDEHETTKPSTNQTTKESEQPMPSNPSNHTPEGHDPLTDRVSMTSQTPSWLGAGRRPQAARRPAVQPPSASWRIPRSRGPIAEALIVLETASVGAPLRRGGLALYPVYLHGDEATSIEPDRAVLQVEEQAAASVPSVVVRNVAEFPALLVEGETIKGGLQDRCVNVSILVPAHGRVEVPVSCIERGRWGGSARGFDRHGSFAPRRVRRAKTASVGAAYATGGARHSDQGAVWGSVDAELDRLEVASGSRTMLDADAKLDAELGHLADELIAMGPLPGQRGVVVGIGRRIVSADLFASTALLAANWEALVRGYLADALGEARPPAQPGAALRFLHRLSHASTSSGAGVGLGTELHLQGRSVVGQALTYEGALVHASAYAEVA